MVVQEGRVQTSNCPVCKTGKISIFKDIETKGFRYYCSTCNKSYNSVELLMQAQSISNYKLAIEEILKELGLNPDNFTKDRYLQNYTAYQERKTEINVIMSKANWHLVNNMPSLSVSLLESNGLWDGFTSDKINAVFGDILGCLNWLQFNALIQHIECTGLTKQAFRGRDCFVLPLEITPGQIASVILWDTANRQALKPIKSIEINEGGILGLRDIHETNECILFNNITDYLKLRRLWFSDNITKPPFACCVSRNRENFHYNTNLALSFLGQDKVIFWDYGHQTEIINYARQLKDRGFIATKPYIAPDGVATITYSNNLHKLLSDIRKHAEPWQVALKDWLIDKVPVEQIVFVEQLSPRLSNEEIESLKNVCSVTEWNRIKHCFETKANIESFRYNNDLIIIRPDLGLYKFNQGTETTGEELISEVYPEVQEVTVIDSKTYMSGIIHFQDNEIPFTETEETIRRDIGNWLTAKCVETFGFPRINQQYRRKLLDIVLTWKKPVVKKSIGHIGWQPTTNSWVFPLFEITQGKFVGTSGNPSSIYLPGTTLDYTKIEFPGPIQLNRWTSSSSSVPLFSLLICLLHNLIAPTINKNTKGIVLNGDFDQCNKLVNFVGRSLGLVSMACKTTMTREDVIDIATMEKKHHFPVILQTNNFEGKAWKYWMSFLGGRNCIVTASHRALNKLIATDQWLIVNVPMMDDDNLSMIFDGFTDLIPLVLRSVQEGDIKFSNEWSLIGSIASVVENYLLKGFPKFDTKTITKAKNNIVASPSEHWNRFLWSLFYAKDQGLFDIENWEFTLDELQLRTNSNLNPIYKGPDNNYYIVYKKCRDVLKQLGIDIPDQDVLELSKPTDVQLNNFGWKLPSDFFTASYNNWSHIFAHQSFSV